MKNKINKVIRHPLISGSAMIFGGTLFANFFNFIFNLFMSRTLSISDYGTLASLVSVILLFALISDSFIPTIVHFSSLHYIRREWGIVSSIFFKISKIAFLIGISVIVIFFIFQGLISEFFNIHNTALIVLLSFIIFGSFSYSVNRAMLQSMLAFKYLSLTSILGSFIKLILGIAFVKMGFGVMGAMWAFLISFFIPYLSTFFPLKFVFTKRTDDDPTIKFNALIKYGGPAALAILGLTFFITSDIILVKHFFNTEEAGIYAGLSLIGRIIFFFSAPVGLVMFPLIVQKYGKKENYKSVFFLSIGLVTLASLSITAFYYFFPGFVINLILKRDEYMVIKEMLWIFGVFISLYSIASIATNFFLSIKKASVFVPILSLAIAQIALIYLFHSSFMQIIYISIFCMISLLLYYGLYYWMIYGKGKKE